MARIESAATRRLFTLVVITLMALVTSGVVVRVPVNAEGDVVVNAELGLVTALFSTPMDAHPGDTMSVYVGASTHARRVRIDSISTTIDHMVEVTGHVPPSSGPPRSGRAYIPTGTTSLLRFVVTSA